MHISWDILYTWKPFCITQTQNDIHCHHSIGISVSHYSTAANAFSYRDVWTTDKLYHTKLIEYQPNAIQIRGENIDSHAPWPDSSIANMALTIQQKHYLWRRRILLTNVISVSSNYNQWICIFKMRNLSAWYVSFGKEKCQIPKFSKSPKYFIW